MEPLKTALITGFHPYDVPPFVELFRALPGLDVYPQDIENFACNGGDARGWYDALVFYNMNMTPEGSPFEAQLKDMLQWLGTAGQGITLMHHALLAYPGEAVWSEMVGIADRSFDFHLGRQVRVEVTDSAHPITRGLEPFEIADETYTMAEAGEGNHVLLTTSHEPSMRTLAWTRTFRQSRVFCLQHGHDNQAWSHPSFRQVLGRGIEWTCARI